jgi:NAD-dependent dihydropyrimidine dehydrogenase PreA subunit
VNAIPTLANKQDCCGCAACASVCPQNSIYMEADYTGFLYPIIDGDKCIDCNLCEKTCPVISPLMAKIEEPVAYIVQHKDEEIRRQSTSGGAFTAIAQAIIENGGVVFGAAFDEDFVVKHKYIDNEKDLYKFRNSKYVQSEIGDTYKHTKMFLEQGRWVCFSGTPCQIQGLLKYLDSFYEKLITVDVVCLAVPSPLIFKKYKNLMERKTGEVNEISFRDKGYGYSYPTLLIKGSKKNYRRGSESDLWLRMFLNGVCNRSSCGDCIFQRGFHVSDFTIWDCNNVNQKAPKFNDNKGTSNIIIWSYKGKKVFIQIEKYLRTMKVYANNSINEIIRRDKRRTTYNSEKFFNDAATLDESIFFEQYFPTNYKMHILRTGRYLTYKLGIYDLLRNNIRWFKG